MIAKIYNVLFIFLFVLISCKSIPDGVEGDRAENLAKKMLEFANISAWENTTAVEFTFANLRHHLWDKKRNYIFYKKNNITVYYRKYDFYGKVFIDQREIVDTKKKQEYINEAFSAFINDFYWLQPAFHIYSPGAKRFFIKENLLRVTFYEGGITPGDTYLFYLDENGKIETMQMWVQILPIKGLKADFVDYIQTETGVKIAKLRKTSLKNIELTNIKFYKTFPENTQKDPFKGILY